MPTNDEIITRDLSKWEKEFIDNESAMVTLKVKRLNDMLNEARSDTASKHIEVIWNWWATKPQKSKNDATTRIITRADIEELVRMME